MKHSEFEKKLNVKNQPKLTNWPVAPTTNSTIAQNKIKPTKSSQLIMIKPRTKTTKTNHLSFDSTTLL